MSKMIKEHCAAALSVYMVCVRVGMGGGGYFFVIYCEQ